ncbi:MAG: GNAT family N-acetyltransferase [Clostridia bacterium]|nr:GNAT family N-acetyltransferase [Clostridia bacterium]
MAERFSWLESLLRPASLPASPEDFFARLPVIDTPRLTLRRMRMQDAPDIYAYSKDPEVARHVLWDAHASIWDSRAYLRFILRQYRSGQPSSWGIEEKGTGRLIGTIGYMWYSGENSTVELGYSLARDRWNQGYMTEALQAVLQETFEVLHINRAEAQHFTDNPASGRVMLKCGMTLEGTLRQRIFHRGQFRDVSLWAITRADWEKQHRST